MTVGELREYLKNLDDDVEVLLEIDDQSCYDSYHAAELTGATTHQNKWTKAWTLYLGGHVE